MYCESAERRSSVDDEVWSYRLRRGRQKPEGHAEHGLFRVPRDGGPRVALVPFGGVRGELLACDREHAYFDGERGLARVSLGGGAATALRTSGARIAVGSREVYVATTPGIVRLAEGSSEIDLVAPVADAGLGGGRCTE